MLLRIGSLWVNMLLASCDLADDSLWFLERRNPEPRATEGLKSAIKYLQCITCIIGNCSSHLDLTEIDMLYP